MFDFASRFRDAVGASPLVVSLRLMIGGVVACWNYVLCDLQARQAPNNVAMRRSPGSGSLELFPDEERPGSRGFDIEHRTVLVNSKDLAEALDGQRLGVIDYGSGDTQLQLERS